LEAARRKVIILGYVALILCVMAVTASFAWMSISSTPTVTDLALSVVSDNALEIAPDNNGTPGTWSSILDLNELAKLDEPLVPITFVGEENSFYAPSYGIDGRMSNPKAVKLNDEQGNLLPEYDNKGYFCSYSFWIRTTASYCTVNLTEAVERQDGILGGGTFVAAEPEWNTETFEHDPTTVEKMVRMAVKAEATEYEEMKTFLYDPAYEEGQKTVSVNGGKYEGNNRLIRQTVTNWTEDSPILKDSVIYKPGKFLDNTKGLFTLQPAVSRKITVYFWVEGQDPDCNNQAKGSRILANLQFSGELDNGSGITPE